MTCRQEFINIIKHRIELIAYRSIPFAQRMVMTRSEFFSKFDYHFLNEISECELIRSNDKRWNWYLNASDKQWKRAVSEARREAWKELY